MNDEYEITLEEVDSVAFDLINKMSAKAWYCLDDDKSINTILANISGICMMAESLKKYLDGDD